MPEGPAVTPPRDDESGSEHDRDRDRPEAMDHALVESARGAASAAAAPFPGLLAEPGVRVSTHGALHDRLPLSGFQAAQRCSLSCISDTRCHGPFGPAQSAPPFGDASFGIAATN